MPDLGALMRQAQKLQENVQKVQEELATMTVDAQAGGGMVAATVNGQFELVKLTIDKSVVDPADIGMLQDLVIAAINQAVAKMRDLSKEKMAGLMGGMSIPGMPGAF
ncbi:MAG: YbaB/EbfC family nucleoid-associated protein [Candidatus Binatia bacterium]